MPKLVHMIRLPSAPTLHLLHPYQEQGELRGAWARGEDEGIWKKYSMEAYPLLYECLFPGCRCKYASTDAVRKHARQKHAAWLAALPAQGKDMYSRKVFRPRHIVERYNAEQRERYASAIMLANSEHH